LTRALITGGAGFVGRHLCRRLLSQGIDVVCVDPLVKGTGAQHPSKWSRRSGGTFSFLNEDCRNFFEKCGESFDIVFHLAAIVGGRLNLENHTLSVAEDLEIDAAMWRWAARTMPHCVVYFSSSAAYPLSLQGPERRKLTEDMIDFARPLGIPDLSYGWSKLTGEFLMKLYVERYGGRAVAYRPFSGYGEDQDLAYPFPAICKRLLEQEGAEEVFVWGSGRQCRDFIHIEDCIDFVWRSWDRLPNGASLNLSTGIAVSFLEFAALASEEIGWSPRISSMKDKPEGALFRCGDTTLQAGYGLVPTIGIREGIRRCLELMRHARSRQRKRPKLACLGPV
jgi:nucleoside-diphosphate-sugar epimerase